MRFLSVCSGIEAASVAWSPLGWHAAAFSEIEAFPSAVLAHHYPSVPNLGDMTRFQEWPDLGPIDLLCGGTPCQSFSVAGLRKGLADPRGNLMLTFGAIAAKHRPRWLVWENVPGVLSSNGGGDFGAFLGLLGELGYGFAYRVLDAQYAGLAQRRKRVFVVGCLGDWRRAAAVLFERHSLQGNPAPSRQARQAVASGLGAGSKRSGGRVGRREAAGNQLIAATLDASYGRLQGASGQDANHGHSHLVTHSLTGEGFDASEDGTGRGTPLVPVAFTQNSRSEVRHIDGDGQIIGALAAEPGAQQQNYIAFSAKDYGGDATEDLSPTLRAGAHSGSHANAGVMPAIAFDARQSDVIQYGDKTGPLDTDAAVRRLTPKECARLQGFPDDYLDITYRGKPAADGPKYKALGNSWAVPCVSWIGQRIQAVEAISEKAAA